ncbi:MAG: hypothetical protein Q9212_004417 [Teloschistes hypoglaucus]
MPINLAQTRSQPGNKKATTFKVTEASIRQLQAHYGKQKPEFVRKARATVDLRAGSKKVYLAPASEPGVPKADMQYTITTMESRDWDDNYSFWTIEVNDYRMIVKSFGTKWRVWRGIDGGFESDTIATSDLSQKVSSWRFNELVKTGHESEDTSGDDSTWEHSNDSDSDGHFMDHPAFPSTSSNHSHPLPPVEIAREIDGGSEPNAIDTNDPPVNAHSRSSTKLGRTGHGSEDTNENDSRPKDLKDSDSDGNLMDHSAFKSTTGQNLPMLPPVKQPDPSVKSNVSTPVSVKSSRLNIPAATISHLGISGTADSSDGTPDTLLPPDEPESNALQGYNLHLVLPMAREHYIHSPPPFVHSRVFEESHLIVVLADQFDEEGAEMTTEITLRYRNWSSDLRYLIAPIHGKEYIVQKSKDTRTDRHIYKQWLTPRLGCFDKSLAYQLIEGNGTTLCYESNLRTRLTSMLGPAAESPYIQPAAAQSRAQAAVSLASEESSKGQLSQSQTHRIKTRNRTEGLPGPVYRAYVTRVNRLRHEYGVITPPFVTGRWADGTANKRQVVMANGDGSYAASNTKKGLLVARQWTETRMFWSLDFKCKRYIVAPRLLQNRQAYYEWLGPDAGFANEPIAFEMDSSLPVDSGQKLSSIPPSFDAGSQVQAPRTTSTPDVSIPTATDILATIPDPSKPQIRDQSIVDTAFHREYPARTNA